MAPRLVYVVTHPVSADALLRGQLSFMRSRGFDVTLIASPGLELDRVAARERVRVIALPMERPIRPSTDARSLIALQRTLAALRPDIVNASTPKAGLLGMMAARSLGVPVRIYLLRGLRLETEQGILREVLSVTERVAARCATDVACVSPSLMRAAVGGGHVPAAKAHVVGRGSSNGVEIGRWTRTQDRVDRGRRILDAAGIADDDEVIGFVGRFDRDKGIAPLASAFARVRARRPKARLLVVGAGLAGDSDAELDRRVRAIEGVVLLPKTDDLAPIYARLRVLAFPSYREGFPNVPLEAAVAEVPAVGFPSTGVVDAVVDGVTGRIVPKDDVVALASALEGYLADDALRCAHGRAARIRAERDFAREEVWDAWETHYRRQLSALGRRRPSAFRRWRSRG